MFWRRFWPRTSFFVLLDRSDKAVAQFWRRFNEEGNFCGISEYFAQPHDDGIEAGVEIHERVRRPNCDAEFFAGD